MNRNNLNFRSILTQRTSRTRRSNRNAGIASGSRISGRLLTNCNSNPPIYRTIVFYPDQMRVTMRYVSNVTMSGAAAVVQQFRGNSVYDPDNSVGGNQPLYYDQLSTIYAQYCVLGARLTISLVNSNTVNSLAVVFPSKNSIFSGTISDRAQQPRASYCNLGANTGSLATGYLCTFDTTARVYCLDDVIDNPNYVAAVGANPAVGWYFQVAIQSFDGSVVNVQTTVTIDYDVVWSARNALYDT